MRAFVLAACMALTATPGLALSCMPADLARDYQQAQEDEAAWIVVTGKLTFDTSQLPDTDLSQQQEAPPETDIPAQISGGSLGKDGFTRAFTRDITLRVLCLGPWCGGAESGSDVLAFLKQEGDDYVAMASPCPGMIYYNPTPEMLATVTSCFNGGECTPKMGR
ncbi:hypothetical protein FIU97_00545 [Roseivivax sp. THAF40]|uniref:hypothetical protein n=1 Tax=unclassified Roseivivax TaxID=2639302 RepID=UPI001267E19A|nr:MULTISPECIES: hypothetical protein [unclassified Roseivivax]QFS81319.1 hypothetical protein FIV09_00630 [Roseivivax sp. THAF197b]QFT45048.1 hypothetical protein FIU97_00545 [Roseivivax sp. THAF40]